MTPMTIQSMKRRVRIQKRLTVNCHDEKKRESTFHQRSTQRLIQHLNSRFHFLDAGQDPGKRNATSLNVNVNLGDCTCNLGEMCDKSLAGAPSALMIRRITRGQISREKGQ